MKILIDTTNKTVLVSDYNSKLEVMQFLYKLLPKKEYSNYSIELKPFSPFQFTGWDTTKVTNFSKMFTGATFSSPIPEWDPTLIK